MSNDALRQRLEKGLQALQLELPESVVTGLLAYLALLVKWNKAYNLTAVRDPLEMVTRHLLDSLAVVSHLPEGRIIDVGSGAGLPGIPLALVFPQRDITLLDSNGKKTRFVNQVRLELRLANVAVQQARVEDYRPALGFDTITSRAFAALDQLLVRTGHLLAPGGCWVAMKGPAEGGAREGLPAGLAVSLHQLAVPGAVGERRAVVIRQI